MKKTVGVAILLAAGLAISAGPLGAREKLRDGVPQIMTEEPAPAPVRKKKLRGSSSASPVPPYRSTVTPHGTAPRIVETPPMGRGGSPGMVVPGVSGMTGGPVVTPSRPAGQGFQDRARNCFHAGSSAGVAPGQIGSYTRSCVNQ